MPVSLAQAALNTQDDLDAQVINEFRKSSAVLDAMIFHDAVSPMGGGTTLTYGYHRKISQRAAAFRAINTEYTPAEATKARYTVDLKPLGGSFQIDRVLAGVARGAEVEFQLDDLITATVTKFQDELINGDTAVDTNGFDGLDKALTSSTTELNADGLLSGTDWSDLDGTSYAGQRAYDVVDQLFGLLDGPPTLLISNDLVASKLRAIARRSNVYVEAPVTGLLDSFGNPVTRQRIGNAVLVDAGAKAGSNARIVPVYDPDNATWTVSTTGTPTGGTFTLKVTTYANEGSGTTSATTAAIAYNAATSAVDSALEALSNVGTGNVTVTGSAGAWVVTFNGSLAEQDVTVALVTNSLTGGTSPSVTTVESSNTGGYSDLYAVRIGMSGFHGVSAAGGDMLKTWLPDFERAGAVKTGEVEMGPVAAVLKSTKSAAVLRRIRVR